MCFHPQLHVVMAAGALSADRARFRSLSAGRWLSPVEALSVVFRGIYLEKLKALGQAGRLEFRGAAESLSGPAAFGSLLDQLYAKSWVVYAEAPFGGPRQVLRYLARYVQRIGISDQRILEVTDQSVRFSYREPNEARTLRTLRLEGTEFLRRFVQHILPKGFTRMRFYGFWSNSLKGQLLPLIRGLLGCEPEAKPTEQTHPEGCTDAEYDTQLCPHCGKGPPLPRQRLPPITGPPLVP